MLQFALQAITGKEAHQPKCRPKTLILCDAVVYLRGVPVCVATMRVLGTELAELPLVATRGGSRKRRHARAFMATLEQMLKKLGVSVICLPAETAENVSFTI